MGVTLYRWSVSGLRIGTENSVSWNLSVWTENNTGEVQNSPPSAIARGRYS